MGTKAKRFRPGRKITTLGQLMRLYQQGAWIFYRHKPLHFGWWGSMGLIALNRALRFGYLRRAVENDR